MFDIVIVRACVRPDNTFTIKIAGANLCRKPEPERQKKKNNSIKKRKILTCHPSPPTSPSSLSASLSGLTTLQGENAVSPG